MNTPIYLFYGVENYLIELEISKIIEKLIPKEERNINVITYDLNGTPIEVVVEEAETLPFLSEHKVIIAKNAYFFTGQKANKSIEHNLDALNKILDNPVDYSTIIFTVQAEKLDERKKIVSNIKKIGNVKSFSLLSESSVIEWINKTAQENNAHITEDGAKLLFQIIGPNLQILSQEITKMSIYVGKNGIIDPSVVENMVASTLEQNVFILIEKVANLQIEDAFKIFYDLLKNKEEPIKIVALFTRQFRLMLYSKELNRIGYSAQQIGTQLGAHPYAIQLALKQSNRFSEEQLKLIMKKLADTDYQIKTGKMDKILALEMFMFHIKSLIK